MKKVPIARLKTNGKVVGWRAMTPTGEFAEFKTRQEAHDWLLRHECDVFTPWTEWYGDTCGHCGGHISMHGDDDDAS